MFITGLRVFLRVGDAIETKIRIFVAPQGKLEPSWCAQPYVFVYHSLPSQWYDLNRML